MMLTVNHSAWDFKDVKPEIAVLPLACFEPHSKYLPLGTDQFIMSAIGKAVAQKLEETTFLLPVWPFGTSGHHAGQPGTVHLGYETLWHVVRDVAFSLHERGIHKIVVLNNHGSAMATTTKPIGNFVVKTAVRQLNYEVPGIRTIWVQPFAAGRDKLSELIASAKEEIHVGAVELSLLKHLLPKNEWEEPQDHVPNVDSTYLEFGPFRKYSPNGVWGKPSDANRAKGTDVMKIVVDETVRYIQETFDHLAEIKEDRGGEY